MDPKNNISKPFLKLPSFLCAATPLSKIVAAIVFIVLPFVGFYLGLQSTMLLSEKPIVLSVSETANTPMPSEVSEADLIQSLKNYKYNFASEYINLFPQLKYTATDGKTEKYGVVVRESTFSFQNQNGSIKEVCERQTIVQHVELLNTCLGESSIVLSWNGVETELFSRTTKSLDDVWSLIGVGFTEGKFANATSSNQSVANLVIYQSPENCLAFEGLCGGGSGGTHVVSFPYQGLDSVQTISIPGIGNQYYWNDNGNKAIYAMNCPEGCPDEIFLGITLGDVAPVQLVLESELESGDRFIYSQEGYKTIDWLDNSTVQIGDLKKSF